MSSLRPVAGTPAALLDLLLDWDRAGEVAEPAPLAVATSGSTGEPRLVLLSRSALRASADTAGRRLGGPGQWLLALPPDHVAGLQVLFRSVRAGARPVPADPGDPAALGRAVATMTGARRYASLVPTQLRRALGDPAASDALAGLDAVLVGGAGLPDGERVRAEAAGIRVVTTYGMSETCGGCVYDGRPLDGVEVALGDDGRVRLRGPVLFDGYADPSGDPLPGLTAASTADGWLVTRDLGRIGSDGRLQVLGRVDDVVVTGGVNVPAPAVEERLRAHPAVVDVAVVGAPDPEWGERVVAFAVAPPGLDRDEARAWVAAAQPRDWAPRDLHLLEGLPVLPGGKVDRRRLRAMAADAVGMPGP